MRKFYIFMGLLLFFASASPALSKNDNPKRTFRHGKRYFKRSDFIKAIPYLKAAYNLDPENATCAYMLGKSVYEADQHPESLEFLMAAFNLDQSVAEDLTHYIARALHFSGRYEEAIDFYNTELQQYEQGSPAYAETAQRIEQCKNAPAVAKMQVPYKIENLGEFVNTAYPEYSSTFSGDFNYMIFTTRRPRNLRQLIRRKWHFEDINEEVYEASLTNGKWMKSKLFVKPIPRYTHDASISLSADGQTLIYYIDNRNQGDVYVSKRDGDKWGKRESIGANINTKEYSEPSVFITSDGQTLYWVSNKPGGLGNKDIYVSTKMGDGSWSDGQNLGNTINTSADEDAPFITADGQKMYFSSRGHNSMGGYDLFVSEKVGAGWSKPKNLGSPINGVGDDIYIVFVNDKEFYYSSDRPGGYGEKDIYFASPSKPEEQPNATILAGKVTDRASGLPIAGKVFLKDPATEEVLASKDLSIDNSNYKFVLPNCGTEYKLDVAVDAAAGPVAGEVGKLNVVSGRIIDAISGRPLDASVELIDADNNAVVETLPTNPKTGNYMFPVESGRKYLLRVKSDEYLPYYEEFNVAPTGKVIAHYEDIGLQKMTEANKIVITWQFFDTDRYLIKQDYIQDLENVVVVMNKAPNIKLNIIGHTDSDASEEHNLALSENRAKAVGKYLTDRGIAPERLNIIGMGEGMPIYPNDTPENKRWNRRVELFIID